MSRFQAVRPWAVLAFSAAAACAAPEAPAAPAGLTGADRAAIEQGSTEFEEAVRAGNFASVAGLYAPNAVMMPPNEAAVSGPAAIQAWMEAFPPITQFELTNTAIDGAGDIAYVTGTYSMTLMTPDSTTVADNGKFIEIRRRQADGRWLMTHDMFNSDVPLPTAPATPPTP